MSENRAVASHEDVEAVRFLVATPTEQVATLRRWGVPPAVVLVLQNACESRCFFCANPGTTDVPVSANTPWEEARARLDARPTKVTSLWVGGNEPLLYHDLGRVLRHASSRGFTDIEMMTSGLRLATSPLVEWRSLGLRAVGVPIYARDALTHDAICGVRCFEQLVAGLDAAHAEGIAVHLHTIALRRTIDALPALARWCYQRWGATLALAPLREKHDLFDYEQESVPFAELVRRMRALPLELPLALLGMPHCLDRRRTQGGSGVIQVYFRCQRRGWAHACAGCADRERCMGVVASELERGASDAIEPA